MQSSRRTNAFAEKILKKSWLTAQSVKTTSRRKRENISSGWRTFRWICTRIHRSNEVRRVSTIYRSRKENRLSCRHRCAAVCTRSICHACPGREKRDRSRDDALFATRPSRVNIDPSPDWWTFFACVFRPHGTHLCFHPVLVSQSLFTSILSSIQLECFI